MSERGSFCTEYIYCGMCFTAVKEILVKDGKFLKGIIIPSWSGSGETELPIIAGKIGGLSQGEELWDFELHIVPEIAEQICHPVRIAVLADHGERIFVIQPVHVDEVDR